MERILNVGVFDISAGEQKIARAKYKADGYSPSTNTVYQFDGE